MFTLYHLLLLTHVVGLGLALGGSTAKMILLFRCRARHPFYSIFFRVTKPLTGIIIAGMILATLSGIGWLITKYPLRPLLIGKIVLVGLLWVLGPVIDNIAEPRLRKEFGMNGEAPGPGFKRAQNQHQLMEVLATLLMYAVTVMGVMM